MRKTRKYTIPALLSLLVVVIAISVYGYTRTTRAHLKQQAYYTVQQNVENIAGEIGVTVDYAQSSIRLTARSVSQNMTGPVIEDVNSILDPLLGDTPFHFIEYILPDGTNTMNGGGTPFDASDREYYRQGIAGNTGIWVNFTPKKSREVLLNFYTPLYYHGEIVGVFTGAMGGDTNIRPLLQSTFFGEEVWGFLCDSEGRIIASTVPGLPAGSYIRAYLTETMGVSEQNYEDFRSTALQSTGKAFALKESGGSAVCAVARVEQSNWYAVQIVPAHSMAHVLGATTFQTILVTGILWACLALFFAFVYLRQKKAQLLTLTEHRGVIEVLSREYSSVYLISTETGFIEPYRMAPGPARYFARPMEKGLKYNDGHEFFCKNFVREDFRQEFHDLFTLEHLREVLTDESVTCSYEYVNIRDGMERYFRAMAVLLPGSGGKQIVLGFADVDDQRQKELASQKTLQDACRRAEAANEAKSAFLFNMSHDIRTPMNAILGFTDMLDKYRQDEKNYRRCVENIKVSSQYLLNLINNVLDLARIESGKATLEDNALWDANAFNDVLATVFSEELQRKHLSLHRAFSITHNHVFVDSLKLEQIFINVLSNAVKYTPAGGDIYMSVTEEPCDREGFCCYRTVIEDTGIGMSPEFLPHIFDEFARERNTTQSGIAGTGLGMGITKKMLDLMDGTITVESELGKGTRVTIRIPHRIATEEEWAAAQMAGSADSHGAELAGKRVLLAEDNPLNTEISISILEEMGITVEHAEDGSICVDLMMRRPAGYYDAVIMDIQMPGMNGYEATAAIRRMNDPQKANIPIIAMTANAFEEDRKAAFAAGMNEHIAKPVDVKELRAALARFLG